MIVQKSSNLVLNLKQNKPTEIEALYCSFQPFSNLNIFTPSKHSLSVCLNCSAAFNLYCNLQNASITNDITYGWTCVFCDHINEVSYTQFKFLELNSDSTSQSVDYFQALDYDEFYVLNNPTSEIGSLIYVFALPFDSLKDDNLLVLLRHSLEALEPMTRCGILVYGSTINLIRLSDLIVGGLVSLDCLISNVSCKRIDSIININSSLNPFQSKYLKIAMSKSIHLASASSILNNFTPVRSSLQSIAESNCGICSLMSLVDVFNFMKQSYRCQAMRIISFNTRSFPLNQELDDLSASSLRHNVSKYRKLGLELSRVGIFVDLVCAGHRGIHLDKLEVFAKATGGMLLASESFGAPSLMKSLMLSLQTHIYTPITLSAKSYTVGSSEWVKYYGVVIEVFCSSGLNSVRVLTDGYEIVDDTIEALNYSHAHLENRKVDSVHSRKNHIVLGGRRVHENSTLSIRINSSSNENMNEEENSANFEYVQFIIHFLCKDAIAKSQRAVRVSTLRFSKTSSIREFASSMLTENEVGTVSVNGIHQFCVGLSRAIVQHYHAAVYERYDGVRGLKPIGFNDSRGFDNLAIKKSSGSFNDPRFQYVCLIDSISRQFVNILGHADSVCEEFLFVVLRYLYYLREGGLLDGETSVSK